jgi:hypothetical protein
MGYLTLHCGLSIHWNWIAFRVSESHVKRETDDFYIPFRSRVEINIAFICRGHRFNVSVNSCLYSEVHNIRRSYSTGGIKNISRTKWPIQLRQNTRHKISHFCVFFNFRIISSNNYDSQINIFCLLFSPLLSSPLLSSPLLSSPLLFSSLLFYSLPFSILFFFLPSAVETLYAPSAPSPALTSLQCATPQT